MTDLGLQQALYEKLVEMTQSYVNDDLADWTTFKVYKQDKPYKIDDLIDEETSIAESDQENYIIIMIDDEDTVDNGEWVVQIYFLVSIGEYYEEHNGNIVILNMLNEIWRRLNEDWIIGEKYRPEKQAQKRLNHECYPNYYEGALVTYWRLPDTNTVYPEELI